MIVFLYIAMILFTIMYIFQLFVMCACFVTTVLEKEQGEDYAAEVVCSLLIPIAGVALAYFYFKNPLPIKLKTT